jgi:hypothetical protein
MINNQYVKKRFWVQLSFLLAGLICLATAGYFMTKFVATSDDEFFSQVFLFVIAAFICFLTGFIRVYGFLSGMNRRSPQEKAIIESEIADPRTITIRQCNIILTPNYLIDVGRAFKVIPYCDIMWAYRHFFKYFYIGGSKLKLYTVRNTVENVGHMSLFTSGHDYYTRQVFAVIAQHNPNTALGFSSEAAARYRYMCSTMGRKVG